jgi:hypothetical protein
MGRGFALGRSSELQQQRTPVRSSEREAARPLWNEIHAVLGNAAATALSQRVPASAQELYLLDVLRAAAQTGHDFHDFLPWRAAPAWNGFAGPWYRVIWQETLREHAPLAGSAVAEAALALPDAPSAVALPGSEQAAPGAGAEVAVAASSSEGPALHDASDVDRWFAGVEAQSGAGRPLSAEERSFLARVYGRPAPDARIHEGAQAAQASRQIQARAFTVGNEVWLGESADLSSPGGAELLAHEISHVIQNSVGKGAQQTEAVSSPGQPLEVEAEHYGRIARRLQPSWNLELPAGVGAEGRFLAGMMADRLPAEARPAPEALVREGVRGLLAGRVNATLAEHAARIAELRARGADAATLSEAERIVAEARAALVGSVDAASLAALARVAGVPSRQELEALASSFAPYPDFADRAEALLAPLPASEGASSALLDPLAVEADDFTDTSALTQQLVTQLVASLHLGAGSVRLHTGADAAERLGALGTRGLAEGRDVYLDTSAFDPRTTDGRALVAHEVVHVAQGLLPASTGFDGVSGGALAEAEAHHAADRLVAGGTVDVSVGLPAGHVAADGDTSGKDLKALLASYKALNEGRGTGLTGPKAPQSSPNASGTEDGAQKLEQYQEGVDGIADLIGDLDAFDDLCEAIDDEESAEAGQALARVKASDPYRQLTRMYQGAKEGGAQSGAMMAAFENEFDGRGFWGETEEAFRRVSSAAKADAKPDPAAGQAKSDMRKAKSGAEEGKNVKPKGEKDKGGKAGNGKTQGAGGGPGAGDMAALEAAAVEQTAPTLAGVEQLKGVTDDQLAALVEQRNHQAGLAAGVASGATEYGRTEQILGELGKGLLGGALKGVTDGIADTLLQEVVGGLVDKGLSVVSKGAFKAPFVGPLIGLIQNNPLSDDYWTGLFGTKEGSEGKFIKGFKGFKSAFDWSQFQGKTGLDFVGVLCAKLADLFGGLKELIDGVAQLLGTLSAVAYVAGGILLAIGLALVWLAGIGAPLITAGGWLINAGNILGRISAGLGLVSLALGTMTLVFRTAAAFMVPAEMYAEQLVGVGESSNAFGEAVGGKMVDKTADSIKARVEARKNSTPGEAERQAGDGEATGKADGEGANAAIKDANDQIARDKVTLEEAAAQHQKEAGDADAAKKQPDAPDAAKKAGPSEVTKVAKAVVADLFAPVKGIKETFAGIRELGSAIASPRVAGAQGAYDSREALDKAMAERTDKARKQVADLEGKLAKVEQTLAAETDPAKRAAIDQELGKIELEIMYASADAQRAERLHESAKEGVAGTRHGDVKKMLEEGGNPKDAAEAAAGLELRRKELAEAESKVKTIAKRVKDEQKQLAEARKKQESAQEGAKHAQEELAKQKEHLEGHAKARTARDEAKKLEDQQKSLRRESERLRKDAEALEARKRLETELKAIDDELGTRRSERKDATSAAERFVGQKIQLEVDGKKVDAEIIAADRKGVTVKGPNGEQKLPYAQVPDDRIREAGQRIAEVERQISEKQSESSSKRKEMKSLDPRDPKADPIEVRQQAEAKKTQAEELQSRIDEARAKGTYGGSNLSEDEHRKQESALSGKVAEGQKAAADAKNELDALQAKATASENELKSAEAARKTANDKMLESRRISELMNNRDKATKGGGAYSGLLKIVWKKVTDMRAAARKQVADKAVAEGKEAPKAVEDPTSAGDWLQKATGMLTTKEQLQAIGDTQAQLETLMDLTVDVDILAMMDAREKATQAAARHAENHAWAYACYHAEQQVDGLSKETRQIAREGEPIKKISVGQQPSLSKAKSDEGQRKAALDGNKGDIAQPDSSMTSIVMELVAKIAEFGDRFESPPNAGNSGAGTEGSNAQKNASDQAKTQKQASGSASDEQRAALDQALALRAAQEAKVAKDIQSADGRADQEEGIRDEIRSLKAQALSERDAAGAEAESHAAQFNSGYAKLTEWATAYRDARAKLGKKA